MNLFENIKAVIFDMDGTLVNNIPYHEKSWISFLNLNGINISPEIFSPQNHGTIDEMITRFFGNELSAEDLKSLGQNKEQTYRDLYKNDLKEISGLTGFLKDLKQKNIKIGLATMGDLPNIDFILDGLNIKNCFDEITGGHEVSKGKPDSEIFLKSLEKLNLKPEECLVFEDSLGGIQSALNAFVKVIGITTSHSEKELLDFGCVKAIDDFENVDLNKSFWQS